MTTSEKLSNKDINWQGAYTGFTPILSGEKAKQLAKMGDHVTQELIELLEDENAFVAAHVLLTRLSGVEYSAFPTWNGLMVDIAADESVIIDPEQRFKLAGRWKRWYESQPHPKVLPAED